MFNYTVKLFKKYARFYWVTLVVFAKCIIQNKSFLNTPQDPNNQSKLHVLNKTK